MILTCPNCAARVQFDDAKIPAPTFKIRCPKCDKSFIAQVPPKHLTDAVNVASDAQESLPQSSTYNAPHDDATTPDVQNLLRMFSALLQQNGVSSPAMKSEDESKQCRVMICASPAPREAIARALNGAHDSDVNYEISVAADTAQAVDSLREERCDVLMLDAEFETTQKGAAFIKREVHTLRPAQRRRLLIVNLSNTARTADAHEAFINHVNLMVGYNEIPKIPQVLERALREFDDLYRDFNAAQKALTF